MFSKTCEYGIRAMIFVAQKSKMGERVGIKDIARGIDSPEYFIAKIMQDLSRKGMLNSMKGPKGGFYMDADDLNHSLADIVRSIDGDDIFQGCALGLKQCSESHPCPIHNEFKAVRNNLKNILEDARIDNFADALDQNLTFLRR